MNTRVWIVLAGIAAVCAVAPGAYAVDGCGIATLQGNFALPFSGSLAPTATAVGGVVLQGSSAATAAASVTGIAHLFFDGNGNVNGYSAVNARGAWQQGTVAGSYNVNADCTASLALTDSAGNTENFSGVVVAQGSSALISQTDAGSGVSGAMQRLRGFCQTSDLSGAFGIQYSASGGVPGNGSTGVVSLDGQGNATSVEMRLTSGMPSQVASTGSIAINPDCSATLTLSSLTDGSTVNFTGMVSADGSRIFLTRSDAGTASTGTLVSQ